MSKEQEFKVLLEEQKKRSEEEFQSYLGDFTITLKFPDDYPDTFVKEMPNEKTMIGDVYMDQSPSTGLVSSFYTPYGIKKLDSAISKVIQNFNDFDFTFEEVEQMIRRIPNLHNIIKTNLIENHYNLNKDV